MTQADIRFGKGKVNQEITSTGHQLQADVPVADGGDATGPSPHDYLAIALGACTGMTLRMYAQRKTWPLEDVRTTVTFEKEGDVSLFKRAITLIGTLDDTQKGRLLEIANQCPVHKILSGKIRIDTRLA